MFVLGEGGGLGIFIKDNQKMIFLSFCIGFMRYCKFCSGAWIWPPPCKITYCNISSFRDIHGSTFSITLAT